MARNCTAQPPTDEEIRRYSNVPVALAARYVGWSSATMYYALQEQRAPFGFAVKNPNVQNRTSGWSYNISPGLLIRYKHGDLPTYRLEEVINLAAEGVERVINEKLAGLQKLVSVIGGLT